MKTACWLLAVAAAAGLAGCTAFVAGENAHESARLRYSEARAGTQILVTVPQPLSSSAPGLTDEPGRGAQRRRSFGPVPSTDRDLDRLARDYGITRIRGWAIDSLGTYCEVFEVAAGRNVEALISELQRDPRIELAQRVNRFDTLGTRYNDPYAELQTSVTTLAVEPAHRFATGRGVTVAVIDSRIDTRHPELRGSIRHERDLVDSGLLSNPEVHGTAVAGIIASATNNTEGIVGIAPDVSIAALRACWTADPQSSAARCTSVSLAQALEAALEVGAQIINLSLAGPEDPLLARIIDVALQRGIIVVAALADDAEISGRAFPASHPGVIAATWKPRNGDMPPPFLLNAPGQEILTTTPGSGYAYFTGNSLAAAHVTGVAALLLEKHPGFAAGELVAILTETAGIDGVPGPINACRALQRLLGSGDCVDVETRSAMAGEAH